MDMIVFFFTIKMPLLLHFDSSVCSKLTTAIVIGWLSKLNPQARRVGISIFLHKSCQLKSKWFPKCAPISWVRLGAKTGGYKKVYKVVTSFEKIKTNTNAPLHKKMSRKVIC